MAETAVLNNNYLMHRVLQIPASRLRTRRAGAGSSRSNSWERLAAETGVRSEDLGLERPTSGPTTGPAITRGSCRSR